MAQYREADQSMGRTGAPVLEARSMAPAWTTRGGPWEPSATMAACRPSPTYRIISFIACRPFLFLEPRTAVKPNRDASRAIYSPSLLALTMATPDSRRI